MPRPELSPRALALGDKLLARLDLHTPRTMDDLLPWWERQGVLRVELVRLLRSLAEEGQVTRGPDGFVRADPSNAPPPEPERPAPPPVVRSVISTPAVRPVAKAPVRAEAPEPARAEARDSGKTAVATPKPPAAKEAARPSTPPAREAPKDGPKSGPKESSPKSSPKEPVAKPAAKEAPKAAPAAKEAAPKAKAETAAPKRAKEDSDPPPSRGEPDAGSLVGRVLIELRRQPQTCATMITRFPGTNGNTVRGALARLKSSGLARLDDEGVYHPST